MLLFRNLRRLQQKNNTYMDGPRAIQLKALKMWSETVDYVAWASIDSS
jgi:hypothetical protein